MSYKEARLYSRSPKQAWKPGKHGASLSRCGSPSSRHRTQRFTPSSPLSLMGFPQTAFFTATWLPR